MPKMTVVPEHMKSLSSKPATLLFAHTVRLLHCQKVIFKAQHPGSQLSIFQAHQDFLGEVKGIEQLFWVT